MPTAQDNQPARNTPHWAEITALIVLCVYTVFAGGQWCAVRDQLKVAEASLELSRQSNETARKAYEAAARAWVVSGDDLVMTCPKADEKPQVEYFLVNSGSRPAIKMRMRTAMVALRGGPDVHFPDNPPYDFPGDGPPGLAVLGPGQKTFGRMHGKPALDPETVRGLFAKTVTAFLYGWVEYEDGFGVTRHTHWCRRWEPVNGCAEYRFVFCDNYNDAD